ncbi:hypothetical protein ACS0TY_032585 [Phlomoides rotata]
MGELKELNEEAWEWFNDKPGKQWSKAFFSEKSKCDMLLNNVCESFNSAILQARGMAIITMLEWIMENLMKRLQKNRERAKKWKGRLCPRIKTILDKNMEQVVDCIPIKSNDIYDQVSCFDGGQYSVNLQQSVCSCRLWQLIGIPCKHGIYAILKQKLDPIDFVHEYYTDDTYLEAYDHPIYHISCEALWGDTLYIPPLPPTFGTRTRRGRRTCRAEGYNSITCPQKQNEDNPTRTTGKNASKGTSRSETFSTNTDGVEIAPPRQNPVDETIEVGGIATQQSQVINETCLGPDPIPQFQGPRMHQQLHMGTLSPQPSFQSRVQIRAPPSSAFGVGHFTSMSTT